MLAQPTIGTRFTRSASHPIGTAPSTKNADDAVAMNTIVPSLIAERLADLGREHVDRRALELVEGAAGAASTTNMSTPPALNASRERHRLGVDAGEQLVGEDDLLAGALLGDLARVLLVEHGRGERCRASPPRPARRSPSAPRRRSRHRPRSVPELARRVRSVAAPYRSSVGRHVGRPREVFGLDVATDDASCASSPSRAGSWSTRSTATGTTRCRHGSTRSRRSPDGDAACCSTSS